MQSLEHWRPRQAHCMGARRLRSACTAAPVSALSDPERAQRYTKAKQPPMRRKDMQKQAQLEYIRSLKQVRVCAARRRRRGGAHSHTHAATNPPPTNPPIN